MSWLNTILILAAAFLAVFWEAAFDLVRHLFGAQIDLLPALMVYASLTARFETVCLLALFGGLLLDSLSANPLGISVLPLFIVGLALYSKRELILRDQAFAQLVLGFIAGTLCPALGLVMLLTTGSSPLLGWITLWQLSVMGLGGAIATPVIFALFDWVQRALIHTRISETSFRADREIHRGR
jgi:cell shape-determining protein MreD